MSQRVTRPLAAISALIFSLVVPVLLTASPASGATRGDLSHAPLPRVFLAARSHARASYTVRRGDTLSKIAARFYGSARNWPALWWDNRTAVHNPNAIRTGQKLRLTAHHQRGAWVTRRALAAIPKPPPVRVVHHHHYRTVAAAAPVAAVAPVSSYSGAPGSFQACVIARESGGNPRAVNPSSGAGGLYQFLPSTWAAMGFPGLPENASVAMQNAAFQKAYAESGTSPWAPYDGC